MLETKPPTPDDALHVVLDEYETALEHLRQLAADPLLAELIRDRLPATYQYMHAPLDAGRRVEAKRLARRALNAANPPADESADPYSACPACSAAEFKHRGKGAKECVKCHALYGVLHRDDAADLVYPTMAATPVPSEQLRYYDFRIISGSGPLRRHGWFDPATRLIHQVG